jgi:hypothetical protein
MDTEVKRLASTLATIPGFDWRFGQVVRKALDYVIDKDNTGRTSLAEVSKAEKTIFGTKVEAYARIEFGWPSGERMDYCLEGIEFDAKSTTRENWMIPTEAVGEICLLIQIEAPRDVFSVGLLQATEDVLSQGFNKDQKRSISQHGKGRIRWLIREAPVPKRLYER